LQIRLTSAVESIRASLEPYRAWIRRNGSACLGLRREYYRRLSPPFSWESNLRQLFKPVMAFVRAIEGNLHLGSPICVEHGREVGAGDVIEALEIQGAGA
jgi:hypothetical protein